MKNFENKNMVGTNMAYSKLPGANMDGINLTQADLSYCNLAHADLPHTNLARANLSHTNLYRAIMIEANMPGTDLSYANLSYADMADTDLANSNLVYANFDYANLKGANLTDVYLNCTNLANTNLTDATIRFREFPSIRLISSIGLEGLSDELTIELMRRDEWGHPHPEKFYEWAIYSGICPYKNEERMWHFYENDELWEPGHPGMRDSDIIMAICREKGWKIKGYLP